MSITIIVEGGVIQEIQGIPPGDAVTIRDYDVDGTEPDLRKDLHGDLFIERVWPSEAE